MSKMYTILRKLSVEECEDLCAKKVKVDCECGHKTYDIHGIAKKVVDGKPEDFLEGIKLEDVDASPNVENIVTLSVNKLLKLYTPDQINLREDIDGIFWTVKSLCQECTPEGKYAHFPKHYSSWYMVEGDDYMYHMAMTYPYISDLPVINIKYIVLSLEIESLLVAHRNIYTHLWKANVTPIDQKDPSDLEDLDD